MAGGEAIRLAYRYFGGQGNQPLIILHGLLGSSRNWTTVAKDLATEYEVFAVDLRNHGDSPHVEGMSFDVLAQDLAAFMDEREIGRSVILGHSLGGKVAMRFAMDFVDRVEALIVVDIAPKEYFPHHLKEFEAMNTLDLEAVKTRKDADEGLKDLVPDWGMRQFLLTNIDRNEAGRFEWRINLPVLSDSLEEVRKNSIREEERFLGPTQFVIGERSGYVEEVDKEKIQSYFPKVFFSTIAEAGHNPHIEKKDALLEALNDFRNVDWGCEI